jgi:UDP-N-acetylglucosamine--N-acetylmuramyl-(pentapeptide) pyrophosphoryl-undecaprenol N-acetylglucosamine transferase
MQPLTIVLAAGGTGGHLFPAEALTHALQKRGHRVELITDRRAIEFAGGFPAEAVHAVPSGTPTRPGLIAKAEALLELAKGVLAARRLLKQIGPDIVVGFGGYPTVPPILAGALVKAPTLIHEQNAVVGRANRFLSARVDVIATGFAEVGGLSEAARAKCVHVGNPVRPAVLHAASKPYAPPVPGGDLHVLVFGGSQGARVMADVMPPALEKLPAEALRRLVLVQQARVEDDRRVRQTYERLGVRHQIQPFFKDLPERMAAAQLIISRSGASTIAELGVIGRPSILVPLPGALDQDQAANARSLEAIGAAQLIAQPDFTPNRVAAELSRLLVDPSGLTQSAAAAKQAGIANAAERLADLVIDTARGE